MDLMDTMVLLHCRDDIISWKQSIEQVLGQLGFIAKNPTSSETASVPKSIFFSVLQPLPQKSKLFGVLSGRGGGCSAKGAV